MSMTLILWKAPVVREAEEAEALLQRFYACEDDGVFEPSADIAAVADELTRLYPWRLLTNEETVARMSEEERLSYSPEALAGVRGVEGREDWGDLPFWQSERLLMLDLRLSTSDAMLDDIVRLARAHDLVLYDPQGPSVHLPGDPEQSPQAQAAEAGQSLGFGAYALATGVTLLGLLLMAGGWALPIPVLNWLLIIVGFFILGVGITLLSAVVFGPQLARREAEASRRAGEGA